MVYKVRVYTSRCPKCGHTIGKDYYGPEVLGPKFGRCSNCKTIYKTGKKLYTDISEQERQADKDEFTKAILILIPLFFVSLFVTIFTGWELIGLLAFFFFMGTSCAIIAYIQKVRTTLKKYSYLLKTDPELYQLECEESRRIAEARNPSQIKTRVGISSPNEMDRNSWNYVKCSDLALDKPTEQNAKPNSINKAKSYSPEEMAGAMAEIGVYEMIAISEILDNKNIRYNDRNIVVETFAYFYAVWMVNWRGLSREQQKEIWHTYEKKFSLFNRKYYEGSTEKIITDNERVLRSKMTCLVQRVSKSYDVKTGTFYDDGISDEYLADILIDENDAEVVKAEIVVRILRNWAYTAAKAKEQCMITPADPIKSNTIEDVSGANDTIESANSKKILFCSKCGQKLMAGAEFCHKCGAQTIRERKPTICPNCKKELTKDNVFCHRCGQRVLNE